MGRVAHRGVSSGGIYYYAEDILGTSRVLATATGTACYDADFLPFGQERDGNFGGSGKGFILFTVTDSKGHALHARLDVEIKSQHFPKAAEHTVGPKDFNQRVVIPISQAQ